MTHVRISAHALDTMRRRKVDPEDVGEAIRNYDISEPDPRGSAYRRYVKNGLVVLTALDGGTLTVVTVLLRRRDQWTDADAAAR